MSLKRADEILRILAPNAMASSYTWFGLLLVVLKFHVRGRILSLKLFPFQFIFIQPISQFKMKAARPLQLNQHLRN